MAESLDYTSRIFSDRGPTKYFHGRAQILCDFENLLERSKQEKGGRTFLVQGAPRAGKTALHDQCVKLAKGKQWHVANIKTGALWDKGKMLRSLGYGKMVGIGSVSLSLLEAFTAEVSMTKPKRSTTSLNIVEKRKRKPLLLILDEAQRLSTASDLSKSHFDEAGDLLQAIHNGELNKPVILLTAGLGMLKGLFGDLGISRFKGGCFIELGALGKESECAVIKDWLIKEGGAQGDLDVWVDAIAQNTHGWPQHISAFGDAAAKQIQKDHGRMTSARLKIVHKMGKDQCEAYYQQRSETITRRERHSLGRLIKNSTSENGIDREDIEAALSKKYDSNRAKDLFKRALERGILHSKHGAYSIPIPSMRTWLISNYARE